MISLLGGATLKFQAMGQLDAREIHFWLHESPQAKPPSTAGSRASRAGDHPQTGSLGSLQPDRLLAEGNVVGTSPRFSSKVQELEVWFAVCGARRAQGPHGRA